MSDLFASILSAFLSFEEIKALILGRYGLAGIAAVIILVLGFICFTIAIIHILRQLNLSFWRAVLLLFLSICALGTGSCMVMNVTVNIITNSTDEDPAVDNGIVANDSASDSKGAEEHDKRGRVTPDGKPDDGQSTGGSGSEIIPDGSAGKVGDPDGGEGGGTPTPTPPDDDGRPPKTSSGPAPILPPPSGCFFTQISTGNGVTPDFTSSREAPRPGWLENGETLHFSSSRKLRGCQYSPGTYVVRRVAHSSDQGSADVRAFELRKEQ